MLTPQHSLCFIWVNIETIKAPEAVRIAIKEPMSIIYIISEYLIYAESHTKKIITTRRNTTNGPII